MATNERPPSAKGGPGNLDCLAAIERENSQNRAPAQGGKRLIEADLDRLELCRLEIATQAAPAAHYIDLALGFVEVGDLDGVLYAMRRADAYWRLARAAARDIAEIRGAGQ